MGGIAFAGRTGGVFQEARREEKALSNSLAVGSAVNPALFSGDFVVNTNLAALTGAAPFNGPVIRRLSVADRTASYLSAASGTPKAGLLGLILDNIITTAQGVVSGSPWTGVPPGNAILNVPNEAYAMGVDPISGRGRANLFIADPTMLFYGRINVNTTDFPTGLQLAHQYDGVPCGIQFTALGNQCIYTLRPAAAVADAILMIHRPNEADINYGKLVLGTDTFANNAIADARNGPLVVFSVRPEYCQVENDIPYTTNSGGVI